MDSAPLLPSADTPMRVRGPDDLVQAIPYLLGFHPRESIVVVGMSGRLVSITMRADLGIEPPEHMAMHLVEALRRADVTEAVAVVYSEMWPTSAARPHLDVVVTLGVAAERAGILLTDGLLVARGRRWSYRCLDEECCPAEGVLIDDAPGLFVTEATVAGMVALPSRDEMVALLDPVPGRDDLLDLIAGQEDAAIQAVLGGVARRRTRCVKRAIFAAARAADTGAPRLPDDEIARFGVALSEIDIRDSVWMAIDDRRLDGFELWRDLARRLPDPYAAAPLFLVGWSAWRSGNGTVAAVAAQRAVESDPHYTAADLLLAALSRGLDPRRVPRLRVPRSA
ncbi:MAG: hypothetical protein QOG80_2826 [Pseudonocardiales bacterium]|nr:hypothetical protein [Pseudonocardiales bacterium]